jgi:hypothetical protein
VNSFADGFAGLFLFLANWLSPMEGDGELLLSSMMLTDSVLVVQCQQKFRWNDDATSIIDAGIPLMITFYTSVNGNSSEQYTRILRSSIDEEFYTVQDSLERELYDVKRYSNIYLAIKSFQEVEFTFDDEVKEVEILGVLLPSPVSSMNKTVSLAPICGGDRFYRKIIVTRSE